MRYRYQAGDQVEGVLLERQGEALKATVYGEVFEVELLDEQPGAFVIRTAGPFARGDLIRPEVVYWAVDGTATWLSSGGCTYRLHKPAGHWPRGASAPPGGDTVRAPMPAQVRSVQIGEGETVQPGQTLLILEAMKMEIKVAAPHAGRVARLLARQGETVDRDQVLVELDVVAETVDRQ